MTVAETGDADDTRCQTGCLISVALDVLGVVFDHDTRDTIGSLGQILGLSPDVRAYFTAAQRVQDEANTWGEAYDAAERYAVTIENLTD